MANAKIFVKTRGNFVEERATGDGGAPSDVDEIAVEEFLQGGVAGDAADGLDGGLGDGLAVGDEGEGFEGGVAEAFDGFLGEKFLEPRGEIGFGENAPGEIVLDDGEGAAGGLVVAIEFCDASADGFLVARDIFEGRLGVFVVDVSSLASGDESDQVFRAKGLIGSDEQSFDNSLERNHERMLKR